MEFKESWLNESQGAELAMYLFNQIKKGGQESINAIQFFSDLSKGYDSSSWFSSTLITETTQYLFDQIDKGDGSASGTEYH